jgi:chorismate mutase
VTDVTEGTGTNWDELLERQGDGRRQQSVSPLPEGHPFTHPGLGPFAITPTSDPERQAGPATQAGASLPTNIEARINYFARRRFPDKSPEKARAHYGVDRGRIFYVQDGKAHYEEPQATDIMRDFPRGAANYLASGTGPAIPLTGGIVGGVTTMGFGGGIPGATAGAYAADVGRQKLAKAVTGDESGYDPLQSLYEGLMAATGQSLGRLAIMFSNRKLASDFKRIASADAQAAIRKLIKAAEDEGIILTPAEKTNLSSLVTQERWLAGQPRSGDTMRLFRARREEEQIAPSIARHLDEVSPQTSRELGEEHLIRGATDVQKYAQRARRDAVKKLYDKAYDSAPPIDVSKPLSVVDDLMARAPEGSELRAALQKARQLMTQHVEKEIIDPATMQVVTSADQQPQTSLELLHQALREVKKMTRSADGTVSRDMKKIHGVLRTILEKQSPAFKFAQAVYKRASAPVEALAESATGTVARLEGLAVTRAPKTIFNQGPRAIARDRRAFERAHADRPDDGIMDGWNAGLRAHLTDILNKASKETLTETGPTGAKFYLGVFGTAEKKAALKSAMSPEQFAGFERLMQVLKATGRVPRAGSPTQPLQAVDKAESRRAGSRVVQSIGAVTEPWSIGPKLANLWDEVAKGKHTEKLAEIVTSPGNMTRLRELARLSPFNERARIVAGELLANLFEEQSRQGAAALGFSETAAPYSPSSARDPAPPGLGAQ